MAWWAARQVKGEAWGISSGPHPSREDAERAIPRREGLPFPYTTVEGAGREDARAELARQQDAGEL